MMEVLGCSGISWTIMQTISISLQTDNHTNTSSLNIYRPDALPGAQPTMSKHCQAHKLNNKDTVDRSRWRKLINAV